MSMSRFPSLDGRLLNALFIGVAIAVSVNLNQTSATRQINLATVQTHTVHWQLNTVHWQVNHAVADIEEVQGFIPPKTGLPGRREGGGCR